MFKMFTKKSIIKRKQMFDKNTRILVLSTGNDSEVMTGEELLSMLNERKIAVEKDGGMYKIADVFAVEHGVHLSGNRLGSYNFKTIQREFAEFESSTNKNIIALFSVEIFNSGWAKGTNYYGLQWCTF